MKIGHSYKKLFELRYFPYDKLYNNESWMFSSILKGFGKFCDKSNQQNFE
jgi:hypothetical protein